MGDHYISYGGEYHLYLSEQPKGQAQTVALGTAGHRFHWRGASSLCVRPGSGHRDVSPGGYGSVRLSRYSRGGNLRTGLYPLCGELPFSQTAILRMEG